MKLNEPFLKSAQTIGCCLPCGNVRIARDDERKRVINVGESAGHLHQATPPDLLYEITGQDNEQRKDNSDLSITLREPIEAHLSPHDHPEIREDITESLSENAKLDRLATVGG